ncbi:hypothetical protein D3875_07835 [Deinococcus cavernae]|uniref:Uncharacterized protein n=2 Tax=Deinococcus cavernae TaxID=2320857 RepID=A0A418V5W6_9DEIO|nr:hypothetical protein D3875_07835 [Deinococcus cavernae]
MENNIILSDKAATEAYFATLAAHRPLSRTIAGELAQMSESGAADLLLCGRYGIGTNPIELIQRSGVLRARGVKWCGSRYCPRCQLRMMAALQSKRAKRARAAEAAGLGVAFVQFGQPVGSVGELKVLLDKQQADWKASFPPPSRLPVKWEGAGLEDWLGLDYNIEIDWDAEAEHWHVHAHALAFRRSPWCADSLAFLRACWPHAEPLAWAEVAAAPEAAARYSVKAENSKYYLLNLFDLAQLGMITQVGEYLHAVQRRRLRSPSLTVSRALGLPTAAENEEALMEWLESAPGDMIEQLTIQDWRSKW